MMAGNTPSGPLKAVRWVRSTVIVDVSGDIDMSTSSDLQQSLLDLLDEDPKRVIINLKDVPYMDSSGVATLVKLLSMTRRRSASLALVAPSERVRSILEITRLDGIFEVYATEKEAMA